MILHCCLDLQGGVDIDHGEITVDTASPVLSFTLSVVSVGVSNQRQLKTHLSQQGAHTSLCLNILTSVLYQPSTEGTSSHILWN